MPRRSGGLGDGVDAQACTTADRQDDDPGDASGSSPRSGRVGSGVDPALLWAGARPGVEDLARRSAARSGRPGAAAGADRSSSARSIAPRPCRQPAGAPRRRCRRTGAGAARRSTSIADTAVAVARAAAVRREQRAARRRGPVKAALGPPARGYHPLWCAVGWAPPPRRGRHGVAAIAFHPASQGGRAPQGRPSISRDWPPRLVRSPRRAPSSSPGGLSSASAGAADHERTGAAAVMPARGCAPGNPWLFSQGLGEARHAATAPTRSLGRARLRARPRLRAPRRRARRALPAQVHPRGTSSALRLSRRAWPRLQPGASRRRGPLRAPHAPSGRAVYPSRPLASSGRPAGAAGGRPGRRTRCPRVAAAHTVSYTAAALCPRTSSSRPKACRS